MKQKVYKFISVVSVAPLIAFYVLTALYLHDKSIFGGSLWYILSVIFLTLLPFSAYGLEYLIPSIRKQGRKGERKLAFIMCIAGYVLGAAASLIFDAPRGTKMIFMGYLVSGGILAFVNSILKFKASGHACGIAGPYILLLYFFGRKVWYLILLLIPIFWVRKRMGRHTYQELISGMLVGMLGTCLTIGMFVY
jgi:hypothetical protein